jgi:hypothetical protein
MFAWVGKLRRRGKAAKPAPEPVDTSIGSLSPNALADLYRWMRKVTEGNSDAETVIVTIAEHYTDNWTKLFGILMDLDREGIRGAAVVELFARCENDISRFEAEIA